MLEESFELLDTPDVKKFKNLWEVLKQRAESEVGDSLLYTVGRDGAGVFVWEYLNK